MTLSFFRSKKAFGFAFLVGIIFLVIVLFLVIATFLKSIRSNSNVFFDKLNDSFRSNISNSNIVPKVVISLGNSIYSNCFSSYDSNRKGYDVNLNYIMLPITNYINITVYNDDDYSTLKSKAKIFHDYLNTYYDINSAFIKINYGAKHYCNNDSDESSEKCFLEKFPTYKFNTINNFKRGCLILYLIPGTNDYVILNTVLNHNS